MRLHVHFAILALAILALARPASALDASPSRGTRQPGPERDGLCLSADGRAIRRTGDGQARGEDPGAGPRCEGLQLCRLAPPGERGDQALQEREQKSPIIAVGHSAGGDSAIRFALWLRRANVPVDLIITLDPTRIANRVPGNVERFINIYSSANALGGGDPTPARDFHGHFASVDLKNYPNIWHVYMPRLAGLQDKVVAKIVEVAAHPVAADGPAVGIEYQMPRGEPLELWDSGVKVNVAPGDTRGNHRRSIRRAGVGGHHDQQGRSGEPAAGRQAARRPTSYRRRGAGGRVTDAGSEE